MESVEPLDPAQPAPPEPRRRKRWWLVPTILLALLAAFLVGVVLRGTWADRVPLNPSTSAEGPAVQLYQTADGRKQVRAAAVVDFPLEDVWRVVTDYEHFPEIFPDITSCRATPDPDGRHHRVKAVLATWAGEWPLEARVRHDEYLDDCVAMWDEPSGDLTVNRGNWTLLRSGPDQTLVICTWELEARPYPAFVVRNALLSRLKPALVAVGERLRAARGG
jgi:uncharacterized membrane protein